MKDIGQKRKDRAKKSRKKVLKRREWLRSESKKSAEAERLAEVSRQYLNRNFDKLEEMDGGDRGE